MVFREWGTQFSRLFLRYRLEPAALLADAGAATSRKGKTPRDWLFLLLAILCLAGWPFLALKIGDGDLGNKYLFALGFVLYPMFVETLGIDLRRQEMSGGEVSPARARAYAFSGVIGVTIVIATMAVLAAKIGGGDWRGFVWGVLLGVSLVVARDAVALGLAWSGGWPLYEKDTRLPDLLDKPIRQDLDDEAT